MIIILASAKTLDYSSPSNTTEFTLPKLLSHTKILINLCRKLKLENFKKLMKVSDKIATENMERFAKWSPDFTLNNSRQAVLTFNGAVFASLNALSLETEDLSWSQNHLRIISGLHGVLRPLDLIQAYRLEMNTRLTNPRGKDLYFFWENLITDSLKRDLTAQGDNILVNLSSGEYFKSIDTQRLKATVITPVFHDYKNGTYKVISVYAKKARGLMSRFIIKNKISSLNDITEFNEDGYCYDSKNSTKTTPLFKRKL
jgi:uncharacterized protein